MHEILTEESLVRYWEEFGTIAFDSTHDTLLTACALKNPDGRSNDPVVDCAFSFMIRRDDHEMYVLRSSHNPPPLPPARRLLLTGCSTCRPTIIVGNFLPHDPQN